MLLFLSMRLSFTCSHQDHSPPWGLCPTCPYCWHFFFLFCNSECVCGKKRLYVCLCGLVFLSVSMCLWLRWLFPLPENVLRQESGLEKVSAALSICDVVPNWVRSHFRLAWSNTAHAQRKHCQKVVECWERMHLAKKTSLRGYKQKHVTAKHCPKMWQTKKNNN